MKHFRKFSMLAFCIFSAPISSENIIDCSANEKSPLSSPLELLTSIQCNHNLLGLNNCPSVSVEISRAIYGNVQNDLGSGTSIQAGNNMQKKINEALGFVSANSETELWHFLVKGKIIHHFVVIPWYQDSDRRVVYTVYMAYEGKYSLDAYVNQRSPAPSGPKGYKTVWTTSHLSRMFSDLLTTRRGWQEYFGEVGQHQAETITYWKYKTISLNSAISNTNSCFKLKISTPQSMSETRTLLSLPAY